MGTAEGAKKAVATIKAKYGNNFYNNIGRKGGQNGNTGGFASSRELASRAGAIGGRKSKRGAGKEWELWAFTDDNRVFMCALVSGKAKAMRERKRLLDETRAVEIKLVEH